MHKTIPMCGEQEYHNRFFNGIVCERCGASIKRSRSISLFTHEVICIPCLEREDVARAQLIDEGFTIPQLDGCGYIPESVEGILFPDE
jgi:hypothetical protein